MKWTWTRNFPRRGMATSVGMVIDWSIDGWMDWLMGSISPELSLVQSNCTENRLRYGSDRLRKCIIIIPQGSRMPRVIIMWGMRDDDHNWFRDQEDQYLLSIKDDSIVHVHCSEWNFSLFTRACFAFTISFWCFVCRWVGWWCVLDRQGTFLLNSPFPWIA